MRFVYVECNSKKASLRITMDAGSGIEFGGAWTPGIAHLAEHLAFQGTNQLTQEELTRTMASLGTDWNAATWHNKVSFYITTPAENIVLAGTLLRDMLLDRTFTKDVLDKEKLVVLEEERGGRDDVDGVIIEKLDKFLCSGPLAVPIIGTVKSIKSIKLPEVQKFFDTYYRLENMLITLTGPKDIDVKAITKLFGKNNKFKRFKKDETTHNNKKKKIIYGDIQQSRLFVCFNAFPVIHKDTLALSFMNKFFGEDMDSTLFQALRQKAGLCYSTGGWLSLHDDIGWYIIGINTNKESVVKSMDLIDEEIAKLLKDGPSAEEMERARNKYLSEIYSYLETASGTNSLITSRSFYGKSGTDDLVKRIKEIKAKDVVRVAKKVFVEENKKVFACLPK